MTAPRRSAKYPGTKLGPGLGYRTSPRALPTPANDPLGAPRSPWFGPQKKAAEPFGKRLPSVPGGDPRKDWRDVFPKKMGKFAGLLALFTTADLLLGRHNQARFQPPPGWTLCAGPCSPKGVNDISAGSCYCFTGVSRIPLGEFSSRLVEGHVNPDGSVDYIYVWKPPSPFIVGSNWRTLSRLPNNVPYPNRNPFPLSHPAADPFSLPINAPAPIPQPIPFPLLPFLQPNPWRSPNESSRRGPRPRPRGNADLDSLPRSMSRTNGRNRPWQGVKPSPRTRPPKGTKERKLLMVRGRATKFLWNAVNFVTESNDFVNALFEALPKKLRLRKGGWAPQDKVKQLYQHFNEIDPALALQNLFWQEVGDRAAGYTGKLAKRSTRNAWNRGLSTGRSPTFGPVS